MATLSSYTIPGGIGQSVTLTAGGIAGEVFWDAPTGADKCTLARNGNQCTVTRTALGAIRVRASSNPYLGQSIGVDDGNCKLLADGRLEVTATGFHRHGYNQRATSQAGASVKWRAAKGLVCGVTRESDDVRFQAGALEGKIQEFRVTATNVEYYVDNVFQSSLALNNSRVYVDIFHYPSGDIGLGADWKTSVGQILPRPEYSGDWGYTEVLTAEPLVADFTLPASVNFGETVAVVNQSTGGQGAKTYQWKLNGANYSTAENVTFSGLSAGDHAISITVTDASNTTATLTKNIFVGQITGANHVTVGNTLQLSTNIPSPVWTTNSQNPNRNTISAGGLLSANKAETIIVTAEQGTRLATKQIVVYQPAVADFTVPAGLVAGQSFASSNTSTGSIAAYLWELGGQTVGTGANISLNLAKGDYSLKLTVIDQFGATNSKTVNFVVLNVPPTIVDKSPLPHAQIGKNYQRQFKVMGGSGSGLFSLQVQGNLPNNSLNNAGLLDIPVVGGNDYNFILLFTDADDRTVSKAFSIPVSEYAYIQLEYKRPLKRNPIVTATEFPVIEGLPDIAEDAPLKYEYDVTLMASGQQKVKDLEKFFEDHRLRQPFLWYDADWDELRLVYAVSPFPSERMLAYGGVQVTLKDV